MVSQEGSCYAVPAKPITIRAISLGIMYKSNCRRFQLVKAVFIIKDFGIYFALSYPQSGVEAEGKVIMGWQGVLNPKVFLSGLES